MRQFRGRRRGQRCQVRRLSGLLSRRLLTQTAKGCLRYLFNFSIRPLGRIEKKFF